MVKGSGRKERERAGEPASDDAQERSAPELRGADFTDELVHHRLHEIDHIGCQAYLVALAAWQRGLQVRFHYDPGQCGPRFSHLEQAGFRGEFFTIRDDERSHGFCRVMGDATSTRSSALCEHKPYTKAALAKAGIRVPHGVAIQPGRLEAAEEFLWSRPEGARFLLKPVAGTLARGVLRNLGADAVRSHLPALSQPMLLEEFITGTEYRVYVTGEEVVAAMQLRPASVVGDGVHTIGQLVDQKAALRRRHAMYRDYPLMQLDDAAQAYLASRGRGADDIPDAGERVYLTDESSIAAGGEMVDANTSLPDETRTVAVQAARALGLPNTGLDLLVTEAETGSRTVVLEANQNPYIRTCALPMPGAYERVDNRIAESVVDHYFPESRDNRRHPRASFDFNAVCRALHSGVLADVTLPVIGPDWEYRRLRIPADQAEQTAVERIHSARLRHSLHVQLVRRNSGELLVDGVGPPQRWERFIESLEGVSGG